MSGYWADNALASIQPNYPAWKIWYVPVVVGALKWCAKPIGYDTATIETESPEELVTAIREAQS